MTVYAGPFSFQNSSRCSPFGRRGGIRTSCPLRKSSLRRCWLPIRSVIAAASTMVIRRVVLNSEISAIGRVGALLAFGNSRAAIADDRHHSSVATQHEPTHRFRAVGRRQWLSVRCDGDRGDQLPGADQLLCINHVSVPTPFRSNACARYNLRTKHAQPECVRELGATPGRSASHA